MYLKVPLCLPRQMLVKVHPSVDVLRRNAEGEMRRRGEEAVRFAKEMSVSVRFPFCALRRDEESSAVDVPMK